MAMMLIDQTKDTTCKVAEADVIRAKTGGSTNINYDYENNKGKIQKKTGAFPINTILRGTANLSEQRKNG